MFAIRVIVCIWKRMINWNWLLVSLTGERCPVIGRVSMDAITVKVPDDTEVTDSFTLMSADFDPITSACGIAATVGTISHEVVTRLSTRFPRVYTQNDEHDIPIQALSSDNYWLFLYSFWKHSNKNKFKYNWASTKQEILSIKNRELNNMEIFWFDHRSTVISDADIWLISKLLRLKHDVYELYISICIYLLFNILSYFCLI